MDSFFVVHALFLLSGNHTLRHKILLEEKQLIVDGIMPVLRIVLSRTQGEIVVNTSSQQTLMQGFVHFQEEIAFTTIDDDRQVTIVNLVDLVHNNMMVQELEITRNMAKGLGNIQDEGEGKQV